MGIRTIPILLVAAISISAHPADLVPAQCNKVEQAYNDAILYSINRQAELAKQQKGLLNNLQAVVSLAKNNTQPIAEQLTQAQLDDFNRIRAQILYNEAEMFRASSMERDMKIIFNLCLASADTDSLMKGYIADHGTIDDGYSAWFDTQYKKYNDAEFIDLLSKLEGVYPTDLTKETQQIQDSMKIPSASTNNQSNQK